MGQKGGTLLLDCRGGVPYLFHTFIPKPEYLFMGDSAFPFLRLKYKSHIARSTGQVTRLGGRAHNVL